MTDSAPARRAPWGDLALVVLVAVVGYANVLSGTGYTIDDHELVEHDPRLEVRAWADVPPLLTSSYWGALHPSERLWRPVVRASLALDRWAQGHHPDAYHRTNVALHAAATALVLLLCRRLVPGRRGPLLGAVAFALLPVHAEAVAGVVGRCEVLALLLALAGLLLHLRAREQAPPPGAGPARRALGALARPVPAAACFFLAFGAKEIALTGPFLTALVEVARRRRGAGLRDLPGLAAPYLVHAAALAAYFAARGAVLGEQLPTAEAQSIGVLPLWQRALVAAEVVRDSAVAVLVPGPTAALYPFDPPQPGVRLGLTVALHLALVTWAALALWRGDRPARALAAGALGFYASLGPVSNLIPIGVVRADRLLYTPSAWACLALAAAATLALGGRRLGPVRARAAWTLLAAAVAWPCARQLVVNARAWTDEGLLREVTAARFPDAAGPLVLLGEHLVGRGEPVRALEVLGRALARLPEGARLAGTARASMSVALRQLGRGREALEVLQQGGRAGPPSEAHLTELCAAALAAAGAAHDPTERGRLLALADRAGRDGTRAFPYSYGLWLQWGTALSNLEGRERDAVSALDQAVLRREAPWQALFNRARLRRYLGEREGALDDLRRCTDDLARLGPLAGDDGRAVLPLALRERAELARALGHEEEARACLQALVGR